MEAALGDGVKQPSSCELDTMHAARRSLVAARDLPAGHTIGSDDLVAKRPGNGISPSELNAMIGRVLTPGVVISNSTRLMPSCFLASGLVRTRQNIQSALSA